MLGRLFHWTIDALLVSTVLAGVKRLTGIQPATSLIKNKEIHGYVDSYLKAGDWVLDATILVMSQSSYFEKKRL
ncbi:hypothetical protein J3Q64DRAFT_1746327 [Phycomyces blakesleeanus]|uniref:DUF1748-domain-containing protein n=1 Tax=Phycomyces blakesleeanus TaxID=4837 RepID=A0ABR3AZ04_PHYBL